MKYITNDRGLSVVSIGAQGSAERLKVERPRLIEKLNDLYCHCYDEPSRRVDIAIEYIREDGILSTTETNNILKCTMYGIEQGKGGCVDLVMSCR